MEETAPLDVLIVDSNLRTQRGLHRYILQDPNLNLVRAFKGGRTAINFLKMEGHADIMFLNPELRDISGFDLVGWLEKKPLIVIVSDRMDYAYYSYQIDAVDFLLAPFNGNEFRKCIEKVKLELQKRALLKEWEQRQKSDAASPDAASSTV